MPDDPVIDKEERKAERKRLKRLEETLETGPMSPWERYRVLTDLLEQHTDIAEMADRKTRFALVILGAVNAVNLVVVARPAMFAPDVESVRTAIALYGTIYVALSLFLFVQAIGALKPRVGAFLDTVEKTGPEDRRILGLRFIKNTLDSSRSEYYERWKQASFADVNHEIAITVQMFAGIITSKYKALYRLYMGLMVLVFLTAGMLSVLVFGQLF
jgi:hypothetical protein